MSSSPKEQFIDEALQNRRKQHRFRELRALDPDGEVTVAGEEKQLVNFSGNDYLGLSKHPEVIARSTQYANKFGAGATASRLISGSYSIHQQLEQKLAESFDHEAALVFNTGFQANSTIISTLADRHALILADKLSHNSLLQGSLSSRATFRRFEHNAVGDLQDQVARASEEDFSRIIVITESLFSMDGDRSDLEAIARLTQAHDAWLFVDDAHAVGVWGKNGLGLTHGIEGIDMVLGTCGKAFGGFGAFLLCSKKMKDYLINFCPGFIYTTALPPASLGTIEASLELIPEMDEARAQIRKNIDRMKTGIHKAGFETGNSDSQIIPIMVGDEQHAQDLAGHLEEQGFLATPIRPPTVPRGGARIRITLSSEHSTAQIENFLRALKVWSNG
ncbi:MAG: 8-amino-7-oxononanoate synthase [Fodinibius sp.]|nr:8-amino-7-oxononanoate synthase [Fodinibius sp.]